MARKAASISAGVTRADTGRSDGTRMGWRGDGRSVEGGVGGAGGGVCGLGVGAGWCLDYIGIAGKDCSSI